MQNVFVAKRAVDQVAVAITGHGKTMAQVLDKSTRLGATVGIADKIDDDDRAMLELLQHNIEQAHAILSAELRAVDAFLTGVFNR